MPNLPPSLRMVHRWPLADQQALIEQRNQHIEYAGVMLDHWQRFNAGDVAGIPGRALAEMTQRRRAVMAAVTATLADFEDGS